MYSLPKVSSVFPNGFFPNQLQPALSQTSQAIGAVALVLFQGVVAWSFFSNLSSRLESHVDPLLEKVFGRDKVASFKNSCDEAVEGAAASYLSTLVTDNPSDTLEVKQVKKQTAAGFRAGYNGTLSEGAGALSDLANGLLNKFAGIFDQEAQTKAKEAFNDSRLKALASAVSTRSDAKLQEINAQREQNGSDAFLQTRSNIANGIRQGRFFRSKHPFLYKNVQKIALFVISSIAASIVVRHTPFKLDQSALGASLLHLAYRAYTNRV